MTDNETDTPVRRSKSPYAVGPPFLSLLFSLALTGSVFTDLLLHRTCSVILHYNETACMMLSNHTNSSEAMKLEAEVQPYVSRITMVQSMIQSILPAILSLFLGPWSDKNGRKPLLLASLIGYTLMFSTLTVMCNWNASPWLLLIPSIPLAITGGVCTLLLGAMSYISDTTKEEDRTMSLGYFEAITAIGYLLGIFIAPVILKSYGYAAIFATAAVFCGAAVLYVYLFVPETVTRQSNQCTCGFFNFSFVTDLFASCMSNRVGYNRTVLWLAICSLTLNVVIQEGESNIEFLFTRGRLNWDVQQYSYFSATSLVLTVIGIIIGLSILGRGLGFSDVSIATLACVTYVGGSVLTSFTFKLWHIYVAAALKVFRAVISPVSRAIVSKCAPAEDIGKVFSLVASLESITPLAAAPLYTLIYSHYMPPIYPTPVWLLSASLYTFLLFIFICIGVLMCRPRETSPYVTLVDAE